MRKYLSIVFLTMLVSACGNGTQGEAPDVVSQLGGYQHLPGFFDLYWDDGQGRIIIRVDEFETPFLYQSSLARAVDEPVLPGDR